MTSFVGCCPTFAPKGAILKSHGETIAGLSRLLKDGPAGRRAAAGRRPVLDQPVQTGTLQPPRDLRMSGTRGVGFRARNQGMLSTLSGRPVAERTWPTLDAPSVTLRIRSAPPPPHASLRGRRVQLFFSCPACGGGGAARIRDVTEGASQRQGSNPPMPDSRHVRSPSRVPRPRPLDSPRPTC